jgi:hypothetical protein
MTRRHKAENRNICIGVSNTRTKQLMLLRGKSFFVVKIVWKVNTLWGEMQNTFLSVQADSTCSNHILQGDKERSGGFLYKWLNNFRATQNLRTSLTSWTTSGLSDQLFYHWVICLAVWKRSVSRTDTAAHTFSYTVCTRGFFPGVKAAGAQNWPPSIHTPSRL